MRFLTLLVALGFGLSMTAGCISDDPPVDLDDATPDDGAPSWAVGDWFTYRWESEIYGFDFEATVVVGEVTNESYFVGMPVDDYSLDALLFHLPAVGPVSHDLAYDVHEIPFEPLQFPLEDGLEWDTGYITSPVHFTAHATNVSSPDGDVPGFHITNARTEEASGRHYDGEYAPSIGWFTTFERVELDGTVRERITLLDHGHGFNGTVQVLSDIKMLYLDARIAGALGPTLTPAAPLDTFDPADTLTHVFAACVFGDGPGYYDVVVDTPTQNACNNAGEVTPDDTKRRIASVEVPNEPGSWNVQMGAVGNGLAIAEVMGYEAWTVDLGA